MISRLSARPHRGSALTVLTVLMSAVTTLTLAACGDSTSPAAPTPAAIAAVSGTGQTGVVGSTLASPVVFEVTTASDAPVSGVTVSFAVTAGSATVSPTTAVTDANGTASMQITLGATAGAVEVSATVGAALVAKVSATATAIVSSDCTTSSTTLTLGRVVTGLSGSSLCVSGGTAGGDFALVPFNTTLTGASRTPVQFQATGVVASAVASLTPTAGSFNLLAGTSLESGALASQDLTRALDAKLRASEARELAPLIAGARTWMARRSRTTSGLVFADDITTTDARYQQPTWNMRSMFGALQSNGAYPLSTTTLGTSGATVNVTGGSAAFLRFGVAAGQTATIQWSTLPSNMQLTLVRTR